MAIASAPSVVSRASRAEPERAPQPAPVPDGPRTGAPLSVAALAFLRGADADARIRALAGERRSARLLLGALASPLVARRRYEPLGFRSLGDYARERMGVSSVAVREWARVAEALAGLPAMLDAVALGEVSWSVARRAVGLATPETDVAFVSALRGRTVRAAEALLAAAFGGAREQEGGAGDGEAQRERVVVRVPLSREHHGRWHAALELARRIAGESLPVWECAEAIAAEALAALPPSRVAEAAGLPRLGEPAAGAAPARRARTFEAREHGLRHEAFPALRWGAATAGARPDLEATRSWAQSASPHALDRALRRMLARLQAIEHDAGHLLRQIADRKLYVELGFESFERYAEERADMSPRTARRRVRLARLGPAGSAAAEALRSATLTPRQVALVSEAAAPSQQAAIVAHARHVTLRRLEDDLGVGDPGRAAVVFGAPRETANVFLLALGAVRLELTAKGRASHPHGAGPQEALLWMLAHAISAWEEQGAQFDDYADFTRDGFRCTAPGCTARRNLQSHHIVFRSAGGADEPSNRTTLCAFHHLRAVHAGTVSCRGRAPGRLVFALGVRAAGPPLLRAVSGDVLQRP